MLHIDLSERIALEQPLADYEIQFRSSVLQNVLMAKAIVPDMIRNPYGRFIVISTACAMPNLPGRSDYVAGKRGMDGVLRVLAKEIGPYQITVNQVAPGWTITEGVRDEGTERQDAYELTVPLKRRGEDQEVAHVVAFLASDEPRVGTVRGSARVGPASPRAGRGGPVRGGTHVGDRRRDVRIDEAALPRRRQPLQPVPCDILAPREPDLALVLFKGALSWETAVHPTSMLS